MKKKFVLAVLFLLSNFSSILVRGQATYLVDRLTDLGEGSGLMGDLRYCITRATSGEDVITFEVTGTINLTRALPDLTRNITIEGPGPDLLTVRRASGGDYRIFTLTGTPTVVISGLTIANGLATAGGGIHNRGTLTISNCIISGNHAGADRSGGTGGGIVNLGTLTISNCTISENSAGPFIVYYRSNNAWGAGISNEGVLAISNSTISGNRAWGGYEELDYSDVRGVGIYNRGGLAISNSTISRNWSDSVSAFEAGGGIFQDDTGALYMWNTILAENYAGSDPNLSGRLTSSSYNLISDSRGGSGYGVTDLLDVAPGLGPLRDNGGPTQTHALLEGSPAIDAGDNTDAPEYDQRGEGFVRIVNGIIDIGAFEFQGDSKGRSR